MDHSEHMLNILKNATDSEVSDRLIELSDKLSQIRRNELRCKREAEESEEKVIYSEKRLSQQKKTIVDLEDQLADLEAKLHRKEEEWRRADNERQKKFFDQQFVNFETEKRYKGYTEDDYNKVQDKLNKDDLSAPPVGEYIIKKSDVRIMQAKLRNNEEEIASLRTQIISKERQLDRLREWQLEDNLLSEDEKIKDIIDSNKVKIDQMHEKESQEMAQAAYKTIKTLQELVETKNTQCKRKEEIIKELKDKMNLQKQQDTAEIIRLNEAVTKAMKDKSSVEHSYREVKVTFDNRQYEAISRRELEKLCFEKDDEIENLSNQITSLRRENEYLKENRDDSNKNKQSNWHDDLSLQSSKRVKTLQRDVERLTKELHRKEKLEKKLNTTINEITDKLTRLEQLKGITDEDMKMVALQKSTPAIGEDKDKVAELDKMLKAKERRLIVTTQKCKNLEKELNEAKMEILKLKESESGLKQEVQNSLIMRQKIIDDHQKERREFKIMEREAKKAERDGAAAGGVASLELRTLVKKLEKENTVLKTQIKPVIAYNNENKSFEYIGEPVPLHDDGTT